MGLRSVLGQGPQYFAQRAGSPTNIQVTLDFTSVPEDREGSCTSCNLATEMPERCSETSACVADRGKRTPAGAWVEMNGVLTRLVADIFVPHPS